MSFVSFFFARADGFIVNRFSLKGGPYEIFAGRDASRGLAKQSFEEDMLTGLEEPIDDLKDLTKSEWDNLLGWESEFISFSSSSCDRKGAHEPLFCIVYRSFPDEIFCLWVSRK